MMLRIYGLALVTLCLLCGLWLTLSADVCKSPPSGVLVRRAISEHFEEAIWRVRFLLDLPRGNRTRCGGGPKRIALAVHTYARQPVKSDMPIQADQSTWEPRQAWLPEDAVLSRHRRRIGHGA